VVYQWAFMLVYLLYLVLVNVLVNWRVKERQLLCIDLLSEMLKFGILLGALQKSVVWSYEF
jgi:hypothetical protein